MLAFFARDYPRLEKEWEVTLEERLERSTQNLERVEPRFEITPSGEQWFDFQVAYATAGGEPFSPADIQRLLRSGQCHTRLKNGKIALLDTGAVEELEEVLTDCAPQQHASGYRLDNAQAGFLDATLREQSGWHMQAPAGWMQGEIKLQPPPLGARNGLAALSKAGRGLAAFSAREQLRRHPGGRDGPGQNAADAGVPPVVPQNRKRPAPRSSSARLRWSSTGRPRRRNSRPGCRCSRCTARTGTSRFEEIPRSDLVITSYALIRRDAEQYRELEFDTLVLDEAQHIKNRQTQNAQAVKAVRAGTGSCSPARRWRTPCSISGRIFDFLMPGYLGSAADFRERYESPSRATRTRPCRRGWAAAAALHPAPAQDRGGQGSAREDPTSFLLRTDADQAEIYKQVLAVSRKEVTGRRRRTGCGTRAG